MPLDASFSGDELSHALVSDRFTCQGYVLAFFRRGWYLLNAFQNGILLKATRDTSNKFLLNSWSLVASTIPAFFMASCFFSETFRLGLEITGSDAHLIICFACDLLAMAYVRRRFPTWAGLVSALSDETEMFS